MRKAMAKRQGGFTLIEIIAVLVILGILAVVAVPKFMSLQDDAAKQTIGNALAAGASNAQIEYGKELLAGSYSNSALVKALNDNYATAGDFTLSYKATDDSKGVVVTAVSSTNASVNKAITNAPTADKTKSVTLE